MGPPTSWPLPRDCMGAFSSNDTHRQPRELLHGVVKARSGFSRFRCFLVIHLIVWRCRANSVTLSSSSRRCSSRRECIPVWLSIQTVLPSVCTDRRGLCRAEAMGSDGENRLRHERLWNRMSVASRGTLNAVDKNEFVDCFPQFTLKEKEKLFLIYTRVVAKMQEHIMLDFKARCEAWELKEVLEELEEIIVQHKEGGGLSFRSAPLIDNVRRMTTKIKQDEIDRLKLLVPKEEEHVAQLKLQREALQAKAREEPTALAAYLDKVRQQRVEMS